MTLTRAIVLTLFVVAAAAPAARGAQPPPQDQAAIAVIKDFNAALLASMHHDTTPLKKAIDSSFNVRIMAASIVGQNWKTMTEKQQQSVEAALQRYLVARFANEFDSYDGEDFQIEPAVQTRGPDKLVRTSVTSRSGDATKLYYRMRNYQQRWRIIDVYYDGVSQLATQRADLAAVVDDVPALIAQIERSTSTIK